MLLEISHVAFNILIFLTFIFERLGVWIASERFKWKSYLFFFIQMVLNQVDYEILCLVALRD